MYFGEHSIRFYPDESRVGTFPFDSKENQDDCPDTWERWHLIPTGKVIFQPPEHKQNLLEIPGRHGLVNVNKYTFGRPVFGARTGDIEFILDPDYIEDWPAIYSDMLRYFHGQERCAVLRDDRYFFYKGFFDVSDLTPDESWDTVKLTYTLDPFKYERWTSVEPWFWDDFDFRQGVVREYNDINLNTLYAHEIAPYGWIDIPSLWAPAIPGFVETYHSGEYPTRVTNVITVCNALPANAAAVRAAGSSGIDTLITNLLAARTGYLEASFENPPFSESVDSLEAILNELKSLLAASAVDNDIEDELAVMRVSAGDVRKNAIAGIAQGSLDSINWHNVYFERGSSESVWVPVPALAMARDIYPDKYHSDGYPTAVSKLYLRGSGHISIRLRGGTL